MGEVGTIALTGKTNELWGDKLVQRTNSSLGEFLWILGEVKTSYGKLRTML